MPLPILQRELAVAARKRSTFWVRVAAGAIAVAIGIGGFLIQQLTGGSAAVGHGVFTLLTWLTLAGVFSAGLFFTADSLSEEKREGTLGLLFLTDLRGHDVVLGKLAATSLRGLAVLLAVFPVLGTTLLFGGVEPRWFFRAALSLLNALFCSLALGLALSSLLRDHLRALGAGLLGLVLLGAGGPLLDTLAGQLFGGPFAPRASLTSPVYAFVLSDAWGRTPFWSALLVSHALGWVLLATASVCLPRFWQEKTAARRVFEPGVRIAAETRSTVGAGNRARRIRKWLERNPAFWLPMRAPLQATAIWILSGGVLVLFVALAILDPGGIAWFVWTVVFGLLSPVLYLWMTIRTCGFFVEARKSGLFELLMVTPVGPAEIARGYWKSFLRLFGPPLVALFTLQLAGALMARDPFGALAGPGSPPMPKLALTAMLIATAVCGVINTATNLAALVWFGMWMGLTTRSIGAASLKTIAFVLVVPWFVASFASSLALPLLILPVLMQGGTGAQNLIWWPAVGSLVSMVLYVAKNIGFILWARNRLFGQFRSQLSLGGVPIRFTLPPAPAMVIPPPIPQKPV